MNNISSVTVTFGHGVKREEYGPTKRAEVSITAAVAEDEDGAVILHQIGRLALGKVADLLSAPKSDAESYGRSPAMAALPEERAEQERKREEMAEANPPPARRTRGPNKAKTETSAQEEAPAIVEEAATDTGTDEWSAGAEDIVITDAELLSATSKRAGELGARDPIVKLISTFATRTEGAPFKVQEIPAAQRKDYLDKLAKLTA